MQADKRGREEGNDIEEAQIEEVKEENNEEVKEVKEPLKFFVQIGDCAPQIYQLVIAFNPEVAYDKLKFDEKFLRAVVEDTNSALVPVLEKYNWKLKELQKENNEKKL